MTEMKLSTAIALGRVLLPQSEWNGGSYCRCALAMGQMAIGRTFERRDECIALRAHYTTWPWIQEQFTVPACLLERALTFGLTSSGTEPAQRIISLLFILVEKNDITLDQLIDWVKSVEPQEQVEAVGEQAVDTSVPSTVLF